MAEDGCILLDLRMPGLSGEGFLDRLRTMKEALPVVCVHERDHGLSGGEKVLDFRPICCRRCAPSFHRVGNSLALTCLTIDLDEGL